MILYSTNGKAPKVSLREAVLRGLAADGGLYMPEEIPQFSPQEIADLRGKSFPEVAFAVAGKLLDGEVPEAKLREMIFDSYDFEPKLVEVEPGFYAYELFHGPTLSFKDFAAQFMARLMGHFADDRLMILVATSGDTGGAVAEAFSNVKNIDVRILYPKGKISEIQERQIIGYDGNVQALAVEGTFDDCQSYVKQAFLDEDLRAARNLASANSINIARLLPQTFYYFYLYAQIGEAVKVSVPSGNFGNLCAGLIAKKMGLPIAKFVASVNENDTFVNFLESGEFEPQASKSTLSNAMDVGNPSNFARLVKLYDNHLDAIRSDIESYSFSDDETRAAMQEVFERTGYKMDPHGAVAYLGLQKGTGVFFETAHPAKFQPEVEAILSTRVQMPQRLTDQMNKAHSRLTIGGYDQFKKYILANKYNE